MSSSIWKTPLNSFDDEVAAKLLKTIWTDSKEPGEIPEEQELVAYVALSLLEHGKGVVTCKACSKIYRANQLKSLALAGKILCKVYARLILEFGYQQNQSRFSLCGKFSKNLCSKKRRLVWNGCRIL
jgi:hypothetical protein